MKRLGLRCDLAVYSDGNIIGKATIVRPHYMRFIAERRTILPKRPIRGYQPETRGPCFRNVVFAVATDEAKFLTPCRRSA